MSVKGYYHSIETCGTVDGPGIRYVLFLQGCPLRCQYCHNPDTWKLKNGKEIDVDTIFSDIEKYKSYMRFSNGGVTISGGEPLMQSDFVLELVKKCKENNIHTAIDTSGFIFNEKIKEILEYIDLVLLDIKNFNKETYMNLTGVELQPTIKFVTYLNEINKPVWIRYVLVPNLTDDKDDINALGNFLSQLNNITKLEILPFHKMGEYKWEELGYEYKLKETKEPTTDELKTAISILKSYNINVSSQLE